MCERSNSKEELLNTSEQWYMTNADEKCREESDTEGADDLVCRICSNFVVDAVTTYCCGTLYCRSCICKELDVETKCPNCRRVLDISGLSENIQAERRSASHIRRCLHHREGCDFRGNRMEVETHLHTMCEFAPEVEEAIMHNELVHQSHQAWESGNQFQPAFKRLHFRHHRSIKQAEEEDASPIPRLVPSTIKFFPYSTTTVCNGVGSWKFCWLIDYQWKMHAIIRCDNGHVSLLFYKDINAPNSVAACVKLISPLGPEHSLLFSTNLGIPKWEHQTLSPTDTNVVSVWDFGEIMTAHEFQRFVVHGRFAIAAMMEH